MTLPYREEKPENVENYYIFLRKPSCKSCLIVLQYQRK